MEMAKDLGLDNSKPLVVANRYGIITHVNKEFEKLFMWELNDIVGQPLLVIIPEHLRDAHNLGFSRFITTETPTLLDKPLNLMAVKKNGEQFNALHLIRAIKDADEWVFCANISPQNAGE